MFDNLEIFTTLIDAGSFNQAAKNLKTSQATISRRMQALEEELGLSLIIRNPRNFEITAVGKDLYQSVKEQQNALRQTINQLRTANQQVAGRVRISIPTALSYNVISPYLAEFMRQNTGLELEVCYQNHQIDIFKEHFDLVITNYLPRQNTLLIRKVCSVPTKLYCSPQYKERYGMPSSPIDGENHNHLMIANINYDTTTDKIVYATHDQHGDISYINKERLFTNNALHNKQIALSGHAIVGGWDFLFKEELASGKLIHALPEYNFGNMDFYIHRIDTHNSAAANLVVDFLDECFSRINQTLE